MLSVAIPYKLAIRWKRDKFWSELGEVIESIPKDESEVIEADLNGHVDEETQR